MSNLFIENDIRPDELIKKQQEFCEQDINFSKSKINDFVEGSCPACGSSHYVLNLLGEYSCSVCLEHLNYFTEKSIRLLLSSLRLKTLEVTIHGELDVDLVKNTIQNHNIDVPDFIKDFCVENPLTKGAPFQKFLKENILTGECK